MRRHIIILLIFVLTNSLFSSAAEEIQNARIEGSTIAVDAIFDVYDNKYFTMQSDPYWTNQFVNRVVTNRVTLGINPEVQQTNALTGGVTLRITSWVWNSSTSSFDASYVDKSLTVNYSTTGTALVDDLSTYIAINAHRVQVKVISVNGGLDVNDVYIEAEINVERYYLFDNSYPAEISGVVDGENINISWSHVYGAEFYEVEWVHINDYVALNSTNVISDDELDYNYYKNSTRIIVRTPYYSLPKLLDRGHLIFRVRAIGLTGTEFNLRQEGSWSAPESGTVESHPQDQVIYFNAEFATGMNWAHQIGYTEDGKRFEGISFMDGLGRSRQSVSKNTVSGQVIVSNSYFDGYGRPVISVLPTPVNNGLLEHYPHFNQVDGGITFGASNIDQTMISGSSTCSFEMPGFSTSSGAGEYYSADNPSIEGENAYIPDANKYPFAKIEYTDDFTGRVERAGAYGQDFKIGTGHTSFMAYATPSQPELDRLFGSEVGYNSHYQQLVTVDANGQSYIQYFDMAGRVVASGLAGISPESLDDIDPTILEEIARPITEGINGTVTPTSMTSSTILLVTTQAEYIFNYDLIPENFTSECLPIDICFDCAYTVTIRIKDKDCGTLIDENVLHINGAAYDAICNGTYPYVMPNWTVELDPKLYIVEKELAVDQEAINEYWCTYIEENTCIDTYSDIFNALYAEGDFDSCYEEFMAPDDNTDECAAGKYLMMHQLSPGEQYGQYTNTNGVYTSTNAISIYNVGNTTLGGGDWRIPSGDYKDQDGNIALIEVTLVSVGVYSPAIVSGATTLSATPLANGNYTIHPEDLATLTDFINLFEDSWAEALLPYHPEYCYYDFCIDNEDSHEYDQAMDDVMTFDAACSGGYFAPLGTIQSANEMDLFTLCSSTGGIDPFFQTGGGGVNLDDEMIASMSSYITIGGSTLSIWDYAIAQIICPEETSGSAMLLCAQKYETGCYDDAIFLLFKSLYADLKQSYYYQAEDAETACDNSEIGDGQVGNPFNAAQQVWGLYTDGVNGDFSNDPDLQVAAVVEDACQLVCEQHATDWIQSLAACPGYSSLTQGEKDDLKEDFIELCAYGCDENHPDGATTLPSSPSMTLTLNAGTINEGDGINEILALYYSSFDESDICTELLVGAPGPYDETLTESNYLDQCGCDKLLLAREEYNALEELPGGVVTVEDYLLYSQGMSMDDIDALLCECEKALIDPWTFNYSWTSTEITTLETLAIEVEEQLTCNSCLDCETMTDQIEVLEGRFGSTIFESANYDLILTNFMNNTFDFHLSYSDYANFILQCSGTSLEPVCQTTPELESWLEVMNLITHRGQLITPEVSAIDLITQNVVYPNSDLQEVLNATHYWSEIDGNTLEINYLNGETGLPCSTVLTLPTGATFGFEDIVYLDAIKAINGACSEDNNEFILTIHYTSCGQIVMGQLTGTTDCFEVQRCYCGEGIELCDEPASDQVLFEIPCYEPLLSQFYEQTETSYEEQIVEAHTEFTTDYNNECDNAFASELFQVTGPFDIYHFTLFYYDQAGNLIKTVAPQGTTPLSSTTSVITSRNNTTDIDNQATAVLPTHGFKTEYVYNSYNQLISTTNPDQEGATNYWYDRYGRIVASQNPVQLDEDLFSYTLYDPTGRPLEVGQVSAISMLAESSLKADDYGVAFQNWIYGKARSEVTYTKYDETMSSAVEAKFTAGQNNLRLRISSVVQFDAIGIGIEEMPETGYISAIHYSYDLHGNVTEQLQDVPMMAPVEQDLKSTQYEFELVSGNVKKVKYQEDQADQMIHEYEYDAMNRLTEVFTSSDKVHKQRQAHYRYSDYGPLARTELGQYKVQGMDYAYTINGWMKGMNSSLLNNSYDMGRDGRTGYLAANDDVHDLFAKDVVAFTLGYYAGDYRAIDINSQFEADYATYDFDVEASNLYNGNIRSLVTSIEGEMPLGTAYRYDQLQRLKSMTAYVYTGITATTNDWSPYSSTTDYFNAYTYDKNGNILTLQRNGIASINLSMDNFGYIPATIGGQPSNRLGYVTDAVSSSNYTNDIDNQSSGNYAYDKLGQLTGDVQEGLTMEWRYGDKKLKKITKTAEEVTFVYNPIGQRVLKTVTPTSGDATNTYYAYDANGQLMATYTVTLGMDEIATLEEQYLYGASRLGMRKPGTLLYDNGSISYSPSEITQNILGLSYYEITNYLGNVNAVVTDRKTVDIDGGATSTYLAVVVSSTDYYPGGMEILDRSTGSGTYRFGYNGMEIDKEVSDNGNSYTTEFRQYDPRLMRWKSLDPLMANFPHMSPYAAFDNNPIYYKDPSGLKSEDWVKGADGYAHWDSSVSTEEEAVANWGTGSEILKYGSKAKTADGRSCLLGEGGTMIFSDGSKEMASDQAQEGLRNATLFTPSEISETQEWPITESYDDPTREKASPYNMHLLDEGWNKPANQCDPWYDDIANHPEWWYGRNFANSISNICVGGLAIPLVLIGGAELAGVISASPFLSSAFGLNTKLWYVKAGISAGSQALTGDGKINLIGVGSDAIFGFGSSSIIQSGANFELNVYNGSTQFTSLGNGISSDQFLVNSAVGFAFGANGNYVNNLMNSTTSTNILNEIISNSTYSFPSNLINSSYNNEKGNK